MNWTQVFWENIGFVTEHLGGIVAIAIGLGTNVLAAVERRKKEREIEAGTPREAPKPRTEMEAWMKGLVEESMRKHAECEARLVELLDSNATLANMIGDLQVRLEEAGLL